MLGVVLREYPPVLKADICYRAIEQVGGDQGEFLAGLLQHDVQRRATSDQAPAGCCPPTSGQECGIAVQYLDLRRRYAQHIGHHLGKGSGRALAVGRNPGMDRDVP